MPHPNQDISHYFPNSDVARDELLQELADATLVGKRVLAYVNNEDESSDFLELLEQNTFCIDNVEAVIPQSKVMKVLGPRRELIIRRGDGEAVHFADSAVEQTITIPFNARDKGVIAGINKKSKENTILVFWNPCEPLNLTPFTCPDIYVFHHLVENKIGIVREGEREADETPEDAFPALNSLLHKEMEIIVDKWLVKGGIHVWAGLFESYKTMAFIELSDAVLSFNPSRTDNRKAFEEFEVHARYEFVLLEADMDIAQFDDYARPWDLRRHGTAFRVNRPDSEILRGLDDPVLQQAVKGKILGIDTMLDYAHIKEAFQSHEWITFFQKLRRLISVHGCVAIIMLVHPTKTGARSTTIEPTEFLKDSITFGGKIDAGMAFSPLDNGSEIFIQPIKGRAFKGDKRGFTIMHHGNEGENYLDMGRFPVCKRPEEAGRREDHTSRAGRKEDAQKKEKIEYLKSLDGSLVSKVERLNGKFGSNHTSNTVRGWMKDDEMAHETYPFPADLGLKND